MVLARELIDAALVSSTDECILWPLGRGGSRSAYGRWRGPVGAFSRYVHRQVCFEAHGKPKEKQQAEHLCGNGLCYNPRHLSWATVAENNQRKREHGTYGSVYGPKTVAEVKRRLDRGEVQRRVAEDMGIPYTTVNHISTGRRWA